MKVVAQLTDKASVTVAGETIGSIGTGLVLLVGVTHGDTEDDIAYMVNKLINLRIFPDEAGKMNLSLTDVDGEILSISQFTLYADTRKGRRPSFGMAAKPAEAEKLYQQFNQQLRENGIQVATGQFGADMDVKLTNKGPVTIVIDSEDNKKA